MEIDSGKQGWKGAPSVCFWARSCIGHSPENMLSLIFYGSLALCSVLASFWSAVSWAKGACLLRLASRVLVAALASVVNASLPYFFRLTPPDQTRSFWEGNRQVVHPCQCAARFYGLIVRHYIFISFSVCFDESSLAQIVPHLNQITPQLSKVAPHQVAPRQVVSHISYAQIHVTLILASFSVFVWQGAYTPGPGPHQPAAEQPQGKFKPIKPDGFHSSASDKALQRR